jgi:hypothetical protein
MSWFDEFVKLSAAGSSGQDALSDNWSADVLGFWFSELTPADWFKKSDITDAAIGERFLQTYASISQLALMRCAALLIKLWGLSSFWISSRATCSVAMLKVSRPIRWLVSLLRWQLLLVSIVI